MSTSATPAHDARRRRADAERSRAAILDAAVVVLSERPSASIEEIARAAGVARQTVYAHFPARERLLEAVQQRALDTAVAAIDAASPEQGAPAAALERVVAASWETLARHARLLDALLEPHTAEQVHALHAPILQRLARLVRRGQRAGAFDRRLSVEWTLAAILALFHATAQEVAAGRMDAEQGRAALARAVAQMLGVSSSR